MVISTALDNRGLKKGIRAISGELGGLRGVLGKLSIAIGSAFAVRNIVAFGKEAVRQANAMTDALIGLQSVLQGKGRSFRQAQGFIKAYISDGLIPATNAIAAYKNLALRGYSDKQIQQVLAALKDSAAFGRQASYTMGEAVQSATEGLRNENSILVDNAGVTKNVAKMWDEYARSIGTTANNLTQQQKIQAEVNGILAESKYQTGDAAKVADSYSGQLMRLSFSFASLKVAVGNAIIPLAQKVVPAVNQVINVLTRLANAVAAVMGAIFGKASVTASALAKQNESVASSAGAGAAAEDKFAQSTQKAGKAAKGALASFDELNLLQKKTGGEAGGAPTGGGVSAGSVPIAAELEVKDALSPKLQAIVDKVHQLIQPLQAINFDPLAASFRRLQEAAAPLTRDLFAGLEWAYYNLFVPLAEWTVESALPVFLDVLSGGLRILTGVLEALAPLGKWLWDAFLQPIAAWTGGVIVDVLQLLADGLDRIADWIQENQNLIQGLLKVVLVLAGVWITVNGAIKLWNDLIGVWNTISSIAANGVKLFGSALEFLASNPIALVIIAITGLVLLIAAKGDEIKELIEQLDSWLQSVFVKNWTEVFGPILGNVLNSFFQNIKNIWDGIKRIFTGVIDFIRGVFTGDWQRAWQGVRDIFGGIFDSLVALAKAPINGIIGCVNGMIQAITNGINWMIGAINTLSFDIPNWKIFGEYAGQKFGFHLSPVSTPQIPMLAKGAVLPPNQPFLAMVGDQTHGTNVEAPLATIQEAVALVMQDMIDAYIAGAEAQVAVLREILEAVLGIHIGDDQIAAAVDRYRAKMAVVQGGMP